MKKLVIVIFIFLLGFVFYAIKHHPVEEIVIPEEPEIIIKEIQPVDKPEVKKDKAELEIEKLIKSSRAKLDPEVVKIIAVAINKYSQEFELDPALIIAVITRESSWKILATSSCNCAGLMQYNYEAHKHEDTERDLNRNNIYHIDNNIYLGCKDLRRKLNVHNGNINKALRSYVGGVTKTKKQYIKDILNNYESLKS